MKEAQDAGVLSRNYSCVSSSGRHRSCGVAILYNSRLSLSSCARDQHGRLLCAQLTLNSTTFQVCNIYGPNKAKDGDVFFESLYPVLDLDLPCILCGDFNTVVDPYMDRRGYNPTSPWAYNWSRTLTNLMACYDLQDIWRVEHPGDYTFTWHRPNGAQASQLDMFWLCSFLLPLILSVDIFPFFRSDHSYVFLKLSLPSHTPQGAGVWKFNCDLLKDYHFVVMVTQFWECWQAEKRSFFSPSAWWDAGKARLKILIRDYSHKQARTFRQRIASFERTLFFLNRRAEDGEDVVRELADAKQELEDLHHQRAQGCRLRAWIQWAEEGETSSSYFFSLERKQGQSRLF